MGYARAEAAGPPATRYHEIRRVVSNLGVFDFDTPDHRMRLRSVHPGVTVDEVVEAEGGAHFTACVPDYGRDEGFQKEYVAAAGDPDAWTAFTDRFLAVDESGYQHAVGQAGVERTTRTAAERAASGQRGAR